MPHDHDDECWTECSLNGFRQNLWNDDVHDENGSVDDWEAELEAAPSIAKLRRRIESNHFREAPPHPSQNQVKQHVGTEWTQVIVRATAHLPERDDDSWMSFLSKCGRITSLRKSGSQMAVETKNNS